MLLNTICQQAYSYIIYTLLFLLYPLECNSDSRTQLYHIVDSMTLDGFGFYIKTPNTTSKNSKKQHQSNSIQK